MATQLQCFLPGRHLANRTVLFDEAPFCSAQNPTPDVVAPPTPTPIRRYTACLISPFAIPNVHRMTLFALQIYIVCSAALDVSNSVT